MRAVVAIALLATAPGCSFITVKPPSTEDGGATSKSHRPDCTTSGLAPAFDTAFGALGVVRTGLAVASTQSGSSDPGQSLSREADIALSIGVTALFVGSAAYGFVNTSRCSRLRSGVDAESAEAGDGPEKASAEAHDQPSAHQASSEGAAPAVGLAFHGAERAAPRAATPAARPAATSGDKAVAAPP